MKFKDIVFFVKSFISIYFYYLTFSCFDVLYILVQRNCRKILKIQLNSKLPNKTILLEIHIQ